MTSRYNNRELSWLEFNSRVLSEAGNTDLPLFERVRFLSIASNNLDEFYMVRVAGVYAQIKEKIKHKTIDGLNPKDQLKKIKIKTSELLKKSNYIWSKLKKELSKQRIFFKDFDQLNHDEKVNLLQIFKINISPILTPQAIDPSHPFPFLFNQGHFLLMEMQKKGKKKSMFSIIILPKNLRRFYDVSKIDNVKNYVSLEEAVSSHAAELFPGYEVKNYLSARVTRDSDIEVEEEAEDLVVFYEKALKKGKGEEL